MKGTAVEKLFEVTKSFDQHLDAKLLQIRNARINEARKREKKKVQYVAVLGLSEAAQGRLFVVGRVLMCLCFLAFLGSYMSSEWVCQIYDPEYEKLSSAHTLSKAKQSSLYCFGIWKACDRTSHCAKLWEKLSNIRIVFVVWVDILATCSLIGYGTALMLDTMSRFSLFLIIAVNRVVEFCLAFSAVLHFLSLLFFTGKIKNQALRTRFVLDTAGLGFVFACASLFLAVTSVTLMALFRLPPGRYKHRRFWKLPAELRPRPYQTSSVKAEARPALSFNFKLPWSGN